jgi:hypothetical protein
MFDGLYFYKRWNADFPQYINGLQHVRAMPIARVMANWLVGVVINRSAISAERRGAMA